MYVNIYLGKKTFLYKSDKFHNKKKVFEKNIFIELYQIQWTTYYSKTLYYL